MRFLIAGLGGIGQRHLRNLRARLGDEAPIIAVDQRIGIPVLNDQLQVISGETLEKKYHLQIFRDMEAALQTKPDVALICTPTSMHMPMALKAAQHGCHLFIEKPLSHSLDGVDELLRWVEKQGLLAVVGYQMRFHPCLQRMQDLLQQDAVGRLLAVHAEIGEYLPGWHKYEDYRQMYAARQDLGGGVILSQIHELDYLQWLFGKPRNVYALGGHLSRLEVDVEDTADLLMRFEQGGKAFAVSLHADYLQRPPRRICTVIGDAGKILVDLATPSVTVIDSEGRPIEITHFTDFQRNQMFLDEIDQFLARIEGKNPESAGSPLVNVREAKISLRMAVAARESLNTGMVVELKG